MYKQFGCDWSAAARAFCRAAGFGGGYHPAAMEKNVPATPDFSGVVQWLASSWDEAVKRAEPDCGPGPQPVELSLYGGWWFLRWVSSQDTLVVLAPSGEGWELRVESNPSRGEEGERSALARFEYGIGKGGVQ